MCCSLHEIHSKGLDDFLNDDLIVALVRCVSSALDTNAIEVVCN